MISQRNEKALLHFSQKDVLEASMLPIKMPTVHANSGVCQDRCIISELVSAASKVNPLSHYCFLWQLSLTWVNIASEQDEWSPSLETSIVNTQTQD